MCDLNTIKHQRIYISALDWGWGHVMRTCSIIDQLKHNNSITIFSSPHQFKIYQQFFPDIFQVPIHSYNINFYPQSFIQNVFNIRNFFDTIKKEKYFLSQYIQKDLKPDLIISDNRYGFYYLGVKNIFITHQLQLQLPLIFFHANLLLEKMLQRFDEIWVPDYANESESLSGKLSHNAYSNKRKKNITYIHPQSLMKKYKVKKSIDYLFIISGTDAEKKYYEKIFSKLANKILQNINFSAIIKIAGSIKKDQNIFLGQKSFFELNEMILSSKNIITRPGYSTLMDLHTIIDEDQNLFLVKPKFQYEQKYLYDFWLDRKKAKPIEQLI